MNDRFAHIEGARIRYWDSGGCGPAVLMTHGIGESLEFWHRQMETLGGSGRLIAWDMPGHGLSDEIASAVDLEGQARVAWQLLDALGIRQAVLVGNSLGAAMSLRMFAQARDRVLGLLLANSAALGSQVFFPFRLMTLPGLGERMNRPGPGAVELQIRSIVHRAQAITPLVRTAIERNTQREGGVRHFLVLLRALTTWRGQRAAVWQRSHEILRQIDVPTVILHGEQDSILPVRHSQEAAGLVRGSQLIRLQDCGHTPQLEDPQTFDASLGGLLLAER